MRFLLGVWGRKMTYRVRGALVWSHVNAEASSFCSQSVRLDFLSPVLCTLITKIRVFHAEKVILQMLEVCGNMIFAYALHVIHVLFIPVFYEPSPIFLTCLEVLLWGIATLWVGRVEACHPSERGMEDHEGRVVQLPFGTLFLPSVGSTLRFSDKSFAPFQDWLLCWSKLECLIVPLSLAISRL